MGVVMGVMESQTGALDGLITVFSDMVQEVLDFIVGLLPVTVPLLIMGIGIPLGIYYIRKFARPRG